MYIKGAGCMNSIETKLKLFFNIFSWHTLQFSRKPATSRKRICRWLPDVVDRIVCSQNGWLKVATRSWRTAEYGQLTDTSYKHGFYCQSTPNIFKFSIRTSKPRRSKAAVGGACRPQNLDVRGRRIVKWVLSNKSR